MVPPPDLERFNHALQDMPNAAVERLHGHWKPRRKPRRRGLLKKPHPVPAGRWFVRLIRPDGTPILLDGLPVDDVNHEFVVWFDKKSDRWNFLVELPQGSLSGRVTFEVLDDDRVRPRGGFEPPLGLSFP